IRVRLEFCRQITGLDSRFCRRRKASPQTLTREADLDPFNRIVKRIAPLAEARQTLTAKLESDPNYPKLESDPNYQKLESDPDYVVPPRGGAQRCQQWLRISGDAGFPPRRPRPLPDARGR